MLHCRNSRVADVSRSEAGGAARAWKALRDFYREQNKHRVAAAGMIVH